MKDFSNQYAPKKTNTLFMKYQNKGIHVELVGIPHEWHAVLKIGTHAQWILLWTKIQNSHLPPSLNVADSSIGMISRGKIPLSPTKTEARAANNHGCSSNSSIKVNKYSGTYPAKTESTALLIVFFLRSITKNTPARNLSNKFLLYDYKRPISRKLQPIRLIPRDELNQ